MENQSPQQPMPLACNRGLQVGAMVHAGVARCDGRIAPREVRRS